MTSHNLVQVSQKKVKGARFLSGEMAHLLDLLLFLLGFFL